MENIVRFLVSYGLYIFIWFVLFLIFRTVFKCIRPNAEKKSIMTLFSAFIFIYFVVEFFIAYLWGVRIDIYDLVEVIRNYFFGKVPE